jgi:hypothetical protein
MVHCLSRACAALALAAAPVVNAPGEAAAQDAPQTMLVLDASGSMWGRIGERAKIEIARAAIDDLLGALPADGPVGLTAYGHRREGDCGDVEVLIPPRAPDRAAFGAVLDAVTPLGRTPMAGAVGAAAEALDFGSRPARVILISDGRDTCAPDPCAAVRALAAEGVDFTAHVIGFDVDDAARADLACMAEATGGTYRAAEDAGALAGALTQLARAEPAPAPAGPAFADDFDGTALSEDWRVLNPDPGAHIVDGGALVTVTTVPTYIGQDNITNGFLWQGEAMPEGDWDMTADFTAPQFTTRRSIVELGIHADAENFVTARLFGDGSSNDRLQLGVKSVVGGTVSRQEVTFADDACCPRDYDIERVIAQLASEGGSLTLKRRGRAFSAEIATQGWTPREGQDNPLGTDALTVLRASGQPILFGGTWGRDYGRLPQTTVEIDRFEVTAR